MEHLIGTTLGQYEIKEKIGQGGMAYVFKAYQPALDRMVAIKVLSPVLSKEPGFTERFQREAHAIARLNHPNILPVFDSGTQDDYNYMVMRYVPNSLTLSELMRQGPNLETLISYIVQVSDALNYAHEHGIIHRDIKPSNVLIDGKWALLADFGLVKDSAETSHLTGTGVGMGTPAYMSPEQIRGIKVDHRTDIYALGIILYKILTGSVPHDAPTPLAIMARRTVEPVTPPRLVKPDIPLSFEYVTLRALAAKPDDRYGSALHFAEAVKKAQQDPNYKEEDTMFSTADSEPTMATGGAAVSTTQTAVSRPAAAPEPEPDATPVPTARKPLFIGGGVLIVIVVGLFFLLPSLPGGDSSGSGSPAPIAALPTGAAAAISASPTATTTPSPATGSAPTQPALATATPAPPGTPQAEALVELKVWAGPGENYDLLPARLPVGYVTEIVGRDQERQWWQIELPTGLGWIKADEDLVSVTGAPNVLIAMAPPTNTPTVTQTPTPEPSPTPGPPTETPTLTVTPTPTNTDTPAPVVAAPTNTPAPTTTPTLPAGQFTLLEPDSLEEPSYGPTEFEWQWTGPLADDQGFEVRVWQPGEPPAGVHNAVLDNQDGTVQALGNNTYRLVADITDAAGVRQRTGAYNWTVLLVQIEPEYKELGIRAPAGQLRFNMPGTGGSGGGNGGGGGGGGFN